MLASLGKPGRTPHCLAGDGGIELTHSCSNRSPPLGSGIWEFGTTLVLLGVLLFGTFSEASANLLEVRFGPANGHHRHHCARPKCANIESDPHYSITSPTRERKGRGNFLRRITSMYLLAPSNLESVAIFYFAATANGVIGAAYARNKISGKWLFRFKALQQGSPLEFPRRS